MVAVVRLVEHLVVVRTCGFEVPSATPITALRRRGLCYGMRGIPIDWTRSSDAQRISLQLQRCHHQFHPCRSTFVSRARARSTSMSPHLRAFATLTSIPPAASEIPSLTALLAMSSLARSPRLARRDDWVGDRVGVGCLVGSCGTCGYCEPAGSGAPRRLEPCGPLRRRRESGRRQEGYSRRASRCADLRSISRQAGFCGLCLSCAGITTYSPLRALQRGSVRAWPSLGLEASDTWACESPGMGADVSVISHGRSSRRATSVLSRCDQRRGLSARPSSLSCAP